MKRISKKRLMTFVNSIADVEDTVGIDMEDIPQSYVSKIDGSYITFVGLEEELKYLLKLGITEQVQSGTGGGTSSIGFNPEEQKWYGWSHRAIFGFGIGSECKKGNCGYQPNTKEAFIEDCLIFWGDLDMDGDTHKVNPTATEGHEDGRLGVWVNYTYDDETPNEKMRGQVSGIFSEYPEEWGKGEWTASTLLDARMMAEDFASSVS